MKKLTLILSVLFFSLLLSTSAVAVDRSFGVEWDPVIENADGTPLTDLDHYMIYICDSTISVAPDLEPGCSGTMAKVQVPKEQLSTEVTYETSGSSGTIFVRGAAVDTTGNMGKLSNEATFDFVDIVAPRSMIIRVILPQ